MIRDRHVKNRCPNISFQGFKTRQEGDDAYSKTMLRAKSNVGVGKGAGQIGFGGLKT